MLYDLDRLPKISPVERHDIGSIPGRFNRLPWMTMQTGMLLFGIGLILVTGYFWLACVLGPALESNVDDLAYLSEVLGKIFGLKYGGWVSIEAAFCLFLGFLLVFLGLRHRRERKPFRASSDL